MENNGSFITYVRLDEMKYDNSIHLMAIIVMAFNIFHEQYTLVRNHVKEEPQI